jgi:hypothetical protein
MNMTEEQALLLKLGEIYDQDGELYRDDAINACSRAELSIFYRLEDDGIITFNEGTGELEYMPSDSQILNPLP